MFRFASVFHLFAYTRSGPGCRICFRQADDNSQYQGISESCSGYSRPKSPEWSSPFRDDTAVAVKVNATHTNGESKLGTKF